MACFYCQTPTWKAPSARLRALQFFSQEGELSTIGLNTLAGDVEIFALCWQLPTSLFLRKQEPSSKILFWLARTVPSPQAATPHGRRLLEPCFGCVIACVTWGVRAVWSKRWCLTRCWSELSSWSVLPGRGESSSSRTTPTWAQVGLSDQLLVITGSR